MRNKTSDKLQNIEENSFKVMDSKTKTYHAIVNQAVSGVFMLTTFACIQFLYGVQSSFFRPFQSNDLLLKTLSKITIYMIESQGIEDNSSQIELTRDEVKVLKEFLEARMRHCEHERDTRSERFNPDTYISQKLLLLDLREWLMAVSIEISNEIFEDQPTVVAVAQH
jgi:hypothetical protein